jgi:membrane fusion protein (multidrug efflux system)
MEGEFDESTGAIAFRARFNNPGYVLKHGATGKVMLTARESEALLIPHKAVFEVQDRYFVYVVSPEGKIKQRSFIPKVRLNQSYVVASGLKEGETIVYEGTQNLKEGNIIKMRNVSNNEWLQDTASL